MLIYPAGEEVAPRDPSLPKWQRPLTAASDGWQELAFFVIFSGGIFAVIHALYLSWWLCRLSGKRASLTLYGILVTLIFLSFAPWGRATAHLNADDFAGAATLLWVVGGLVLRAEILSYYERAFGMQLELSWWKTLLFSTIYLNWCLTIYQP